MKKAGEEVRDQLPLRGGSGKMITTVEPKFIPKEAVSVDLGEDRKAKSAAYRLCWFSCKGCWRKR